MNPRHKTGDTTVCDRAQIGSPVQNSRSAKKPDGLMHRKQTNKQTKKVYKNGNGSKNAIEKLRFMLMVKN